MKNDLRRIAAPFVLGAAGLMLMIGAMAATDTTPRVQALTNCTVADYSLDAEEMAFLTLINTYRQQNGLGSLTISTNLNRAAHWMAWDLGTTPNWSHTDSLGRNAHKRAIDCGYPQGAGENLAAGTSWSTAQSAMAAWQNSSGHNANMLNQHYRQIGIARVYVAGSPYGWYWVTNFGATDDGTGGGGSTQPTNTPTPVPPTNTPVPPTNTPVPPTATPTSQAFTPPTSTPTPRPNNPAPTATPTTPASQGFTPPTSQSSDSASCELSVRWSMCAWGGPTGMPVGAAFEGNTSADGDISDRVTVIYTWIAAEQDWAAHFPQFANIPGANDFDTFTAGTGYWIAITGGDALTWTPRR